MKNLIQGINNNIINCPICYKEIDHYLKEFEELKCIHCNNNSIFVLCEYCNEKIYFKKNDKDLHLNGMNGLNIKCPYLLCGKYFHLITCPKCKRDQKIKTIINEGDLIKCKFEKDCHYEYLIVRCPITGCDDITYFSRPKNFSNSPIGMIYNHKKNDENIVFHKITCVFCIRPIVYSNINGKINKYLDSMQITCPYDECHKKYNRIVCPKCSKIIIIEGGYYIMGKKIKCEECKAEFGKIVCPSCLRIIPLLKKFFKSGGIVCNYPSCAKRSFMVNCIHCRRLNVFNDNNNKKPIPGQPIICGYKDCGKKFNEVYCPSCNELNPFPCGDFEFGKAYKCKYITCSKSYQLFVCPGCWSHSKATTGVEGKKYTCNKCKILLSNWGCPFCHTTILDKGSNLKYGQMVRCPNKFCGKQYSFCRCYECQKLIFSEENKFILGFSVICNSCNKISVNVNCPKCETKICFLERTNDIEKDEIIKCQNCQNEFKYEKKSSDGIEESEIYSKNLSILETIKGEPINFGESSVDENYLSITNLFIKSDLYNNGIKPENKNEKKYKNNNLCILCHYEKKESVFYDCGHRCACYKCALVYFEVNKKCPRCQKDAEAIIPKVYEI